MRCFHAIGILLCTLALGSCSTVPGPTDGKVQVSLGPGTPPGDTTPESEAAEPAADSPTLDDLRRAFVQRGSGRLVGSAAVAAPDSEGGEGGISLDFEGAELREVVKVILGDLLGVNYVIDEQVRGQATLHTRSPVSREALVPILESVLQANSAALVATDGGYKVVPIGEAARAGAPVRTGRQVEGLPGYRIQVVPLQYVSARSLEKVLEPFMPQGATMQVDSERNLLILSGPSTRLARLLETVELFDVDWLAGMSFALYPLDQADPTVVAQELEALLGTGTDGPLDGMVRLLPIERLQALMVISRRPQYLERVRRLLGRLDQGAGGTERVLHVYHLRHGNAEDVAGALSGLFGAASGDGNGGPQSPQASTQGAQRVEPAAEALPEAGESGAARRQPVSLAGIPIIADPPNNALLVMATAAEYRAVERAVRKLDMPRRQVLVEASIAEVTLTDNLQYGLQWFLRGTADDYTQQALFSTGGGSLPSAAVPGFSYSLTDGSGFVRLLFDALASESKLKILSSPQVLVIDNQTANIRVGDQIPIITRTTTSVSDPAAPIVNEVQFRDTGVLLQVTPHINSGGMVTMEITQEVSEPSADEFAAGNVSILQRTINSSVAVQSGETVLLGGLIRENKSDTVTGIPFLSSLPLVGKLFSRTVDSTDRTELVVTITPRVISDGRQAREAARELMQRMKSLEAVERLGNTDRPPSVEGETAGETP